ncbi:TPA: restriction endonuclease [Legionella pneumophila]|uniref:restriction endonuclease subunit S n=1 Tax=Legionella pneumophila TaxID=446 RepID=UPI00077C8286|nr:restriction endonuclease subunit S [Legionella pneumophila]PQM73260.1 restriction endonuclease [Legionella pneumophila]HAT3844067.1 restriction endonuclease [Legionella pneumophila]HAU0296755.1 restriction endonuclease [Legionella pneumophila]HAU0298668.1 restriction endonuclease [Legionella pneumophila]HAU1382621.1 restriction endonuclease [Legionella pneumophila]
MIEHDYPITWAVEKLGEVIDIQGGSQPPKSEFIYEPKEGYIQLLQIRDFGEKPVPTYVFKDHVTKFCKKNDVLIARYGASLGRIVTGLEGAYNVALAKTIYDERLLDNSYVFYLLKTTLFQTPLKMISRSAQNGFAKHEVAHIQIPIPPLNEQKRIVAKIEELFSELDNGIAALKTARTQLKVYRQALLKHAFAGKLTAKWREENLNKLETPEQLLVRIQKERDVRYQHQLEEWRAAVKNWEEKGKEGKKPGKPKKSYAYSSASLNEEPFKLPTTWAWIHLGELVTGIDQGWSPKCENFPADMDSWGVIKTTAVQHSEFLEHENKILPDNLEPRQQHELAAGDILITRAGPRIRVGVCCLIKKVRTKLMNCDKVYRIKSLENICLPEYLEAVLNSPVILDALECVKSGINDSGVNLNQVAFLNMLIPYCNLSEQKELISKVEELISKINKQQEILEISLKQADTLRQSILKKAFSGMLVPQDQNDEPASALLEQIKTEKVAQTIKKANNKKKQIKDSYHD